jgi:hypothetical protein
MDGISARLQRADELLTGLTTEVDRLRASIPAPRIEKGFKPGSSVYAFRACSNFEVPPRLAVLTGELIYHFRSSLDHLVTELVRANGRQETRRNQFPISRTEQEHRELVRRGYLHGMSERHIRAIELFQPFRETKPDQTALLCLRELSNCDKHRLLLVVAAAAHIGSKISVSLREDAAVVGMSAPYMHAMTADGSEFFSIEFRKRCDVDLDIDVRIDIGIERPPGLDWPFECQSLIAGLEALRTRVRQVVEICRAIQQYAEVEFNPAEGQPPQII